MLCYGIHVKKYDKNRRTNGHGPVWSINNQTRPTTNNKSNSTTYCYFHIKIIGFNRTADILKSGIYEKYI
jgi:hypothetical protein